VLGLQSRKDEFSDRPEGKLWVGGFLKGIVKGYSQEENLSEKRKKVSQWGRIDQSRG